MGETFWHPSAPIKSLLSLRSSYNTENPNLRLLCRYEKGSRLWIGLVLEQSFKLEGVLALMSPVSHADILMARDENDMYDTHICDMTHWCETRLIHVRHDSFMWDTTQSCETWLIHVGHVSHEWVMSHINESWAKERSRERSLADFRSRLGWVHVEPVFAEPFAWQRVALVCSRSRLPEGAPAHSLWALARGHRLLRFVRVLSYLYNGKWWRKPSHDRGKDAHIDRKSVV